MAFGTNHMVKEDYDGSTSSNSPWVPEAWEDEAIAAYKTKVVLAATVTIKNHVGNKGDAIHFPVPVRGVASFKSSETQLTNQAPSSSVLTVNLDKHGYYAFMLEDQMAVQGMDGFREFYVDDAAHAIATQVDYELHALGTALQSGTLDTTPGTPAAPTLAYDAAVIGSDGTTLWSPSTDGNGAALSDAGIRKMIQTLDDADVPQTDRYMVIPPVEKKNLLGLARFTEQAFSGRDGASIRDGVIADVYGVDVMVSTNCPTVYDSGATTSFRAGMLYHKSALALAEQMRVRMQRQYKLEWFGTQYATDMLYGVKTLRDDAGVAFIVPA